MLLGASQVFREVPALVESLLGISVSESQAYRTLQAVSQEMEDPSLPSADLRQIQGQAEAQVYGMVDGSFLFTDDGWREVKVGRVFTAAPHKLTASKWDMGQSEYVARGGHYQDFTEKFEVLLPPGSPCRKVFVTDGACWITKWITEAYPGSLQILDFFHVCQKLASVPHLAVCEKDWFEKHKALLLAGELDVVCSSIRQLEGFEGQAGTIELFREKCFPDALPGVPGQELDDFKRPD